MSVNSNNKKIRASVLYGLLILFKNFQNISLEEIGKNNFFKEKNKPKLVLHQRLSIRHWFTSPPGPSAPGEQGYLSNIY